MENFLCHTLLLLSRTPTEWPVNRMLLCHMSPRPSNLPKPRKSYGSGRDDSIAG